MLGAHEKSRSPGQQANGFGYLEAEVGIEPASTELQSAA